MTRSARARGVEGVRIDVCRGAAGFDVESGVAVWRRGTSGNGIGVGGEEDERKTGEGSGSSKEGQEEGRETRVEGMYVCR